VNLLEVRLRAGDPFGPKENTVPNTEVKKRNVSCTMEPRVLPFKREGSVVKEPEINRNWAGISKRNSLRVPIPKRNIKNRLGGRLIGGGKKTVTKDGHRGRKGDPVITGSGEHIPRIIGNMISSTQKMLPRDVTLLKIASKPQDLKTEARGKKSGQPPKKKPKRQKVNKGIPPGGSKRTPKERSGERKRKMADSCKRGDSKEVLVEKLGTEGRRGLRGELRKKKGRTNFLKKAETRVPGSWRGKLGAT